MTTLRSGVDETPSDASTSAPVQQPALWVMWANAALSWSGLAFAYLLYLTYRNIRWARRNNRPWFRFAAPLATVVSLVMVAGALGNLINSSDLRNPAQVTPLGHSANAPVSRSFVASTADAKTSLADRLKTSNGLPAAKPMAAAATDRIDIILAGFNAAWKASCTGSNQQSEARYLWSFVLDLKGPFYTKWGVQSPTVCGSFSLVNEPTVTSDPQASAGSTSRWYQVKDSLENSNEQGAEMPMMVRFINDRWMMVGLSPKGTSLASTETGESFKDNPATVIAQMTALRQQVFIQRSADLMTVYYNGNNGAGNDRILADEALLKAGIVPDITVDKITPDTPRGTVKFDSTENQGGKIVHRSVEIDFYPDQGFGITGVWAESA
jgi:hypothetical protein